VLLMEVLAVVGAEEVAEDDRVRVMRSLRVMTNAFCRRWLGARPSVGVRKQGRKRE
jgi:hypothetical protein